MASLIVLVYIFKRKSSMLDSKLSTKKERCIVVCSYLLRAKTWAHRSTFLSWEQKSWEDWKFRWEFSKVKQEIKGSKGTKMVENCWVPKKVIIDVELKNPHYAKVYQDDSMRVLYWDSLLIKVDKYSIFGLCEFGQQTVSGKICCKLTYNVYWRCC